jgi:response regulator RpfG family c-di-GMP phosphodiesterase
MKKNILIYAIDDSEFQLKILEKGILNYKSDIFNFSIDKFTKFSDLQTAIYRKLPDCFIVDLVMPYMSGIHVLEFLEKFYSDIPKFVNSSCCGEEYRILTESKYKAPFLYKETSVQDRINIIVEYLKEKYSI